MNKSIKGLDFMSKYKYIFNLIFFQRKHNFNLIFDKLLI
jgi:hypothetical protein